MSSYTPLSRPCTIAKHMWEVSIAPLLSISCITYNHIEFIAEAIDGFLMQETTFPVEILIHDDASTDGTDQVVADYHRQYPDLIKPIYQCVNQHSQGVRVSMKFQYPRVRGKYVALCEGDDYWTHPNKLQKQVDFLEKNPQASFVFHNAVVLDEVSKKVSLYDTEANGRWYCRADLIKRNMIPTASKVTRTALIARDIQLPVGVPGDWVGHFTESDYGNFYYTPDVMSVYRIHPSGIWSSQDDLKRIANTLRTLDYFETLNGDEFHDVIKRCKVALYTELMIKTAIKDDEVLKAILRKAAYEGQNVSVWGYGRLGRDIVERLESWGFTNFVVLDMDNLKLPRSRFKCADTISFMRNLENRYLPLLITSTALQSVVSTALDIDERLMTFMRVVDVSMLSQ